METEMILSVQVSGDGHFEEVVGMSIYDAENAASVGIHLGGSR